MNREYKRNYTECYTDENHTDIYVYSTYISGNGNRTQTFLGEKKSVRSFSLGNTIEDLIKAGAKVFRLKEELDQYQVGDNVIYLKHLANTKKWTKEEIQRDFKYESTWNEYTCSLLINPKKYRLHLEHETFKADKFMDIKPDIYDIVLYDKIDIRYHWNDNFVEVTQSVPISKKSGRNPGSNYSDFDKIISKKNFYNDKIEAINYYYAIYEHYRNECMPDIIEHIM